jgi:membrane-bound serine protease (ClpP class)
MSSSMPGTFKYRRGNTLEAASHATCVALLLLVTSAVAFAQQAPPGAVFISQMKGAIGVATERQLTRAIDSAHAARAEALVIQLDTPGGLASSMRTMIQEITSSPVPVIIYVAPTGAHAASAGTFLLYASHLAAMAPGTSLGAATPIAMGGPSAPAAQPASPGDSARPGAPTSGAADRKALNDAIALIRSLAQLRGRSVDFAERAVSEAATLTATEALEERVIEVLAVDVTTVLEQAHGRTVSVTGGDRMLATRGAEQIELAIDWRTRLLAVITDPNIAFILLMIGVYGLLLEFLNPGSLIPGVVGAIALILALMALTALPVHFGALALLVLGLALMAGVAFTPGVGILGMGGFAAFVGGAIFLFEGADADINISISWPVIAAVAVTSAAITFGVVRAAIAARRRPASTGGAELIGTRAKVVEWKDGSGLVRVRGEIWSARSGHSPQAGDEVRITGRSGLTLNIEP